jgi:hypothetical protein
VIQVRTPAFDRHTDNLSTACDAKEKVTGNARISSIEFYFDGD